jgi:hypothetical protein
MSCFLNRFPNIIQTFEPPIRGGLIAHLSPYPFLEIQAGLITWQILQPQPDMGLDKDVYFLPTMPSGSIDIQPNRVTFELSIQSSQTTDKPLSVPLRMPHQPLPTQQRSHPAKDIQSGTMLTGGWNAKPFTPFGPPYPQTRMQGETRLILKDDRLLKLQRLKFFLRPCEIAWPPWCALEDRNNPLASVDTLIDESKTALDELSTLSQNDVSDERPRWDRPTGPGLTQTPEETSPNALPTLGERPKLIEPDVQASLSVPKILTPVRSLCASRDSSFVVSTPRPRLSTPDADPPVSATEPLSLFRHGLPGLAEPWPVDALGLLRDELILRLGFS